MESQASKPAAEPVTLKQQIQCVGRELGMRKNAYPKFIGRGTMTQEKADTELAHMSAVYRTLKALEALSNGIQPNDEQKAPAAAPADLELSGRKA